MFLYDNETGMASVDAPESQRYRGVLRMWQALVMTAVLVAAVAAIAPVQLGIMVYKAALLTGGAWLGYWVDRLVFPYTRPHESPMDPHAEYRRAIIVAAAVLAIALSA